jgi:hypothetical protein
MIKAINSTTSRRAVLAGAHAPQASRRGLLMGLAAAVAVPAPAIASIIAAPAPAPAAPVAALAPAAPVAAVPFRDEALMGLVREYLKLDAERQKLDNEIKRITDAWEAKHPMPDALRVRPGDAELCLPRRMSEEALNRCGYGMGADIEDMRKPEWGRTVVFDPPEGFQYARGAEVYEFYVPSPEARARADEIVAACDEWRPDPPRGIKSKEARSERMFNRLSRLEAKINKKRAHTFVGLLAKSWIACIAAPDPDDDPAIGAFLRDCRAMAKTYVVPLIDPDWHRGTALASDQEGEQA